MTVSAIEWLTSPEVPAERLDVYQHTQQRGDKPFSSRSRVPIGRLNHGRKKE
jgi:hypothetical protein